MALRQGALDMTEYMPTKTTEPRRLALLGTGIMGSRMTKRLLAAGHSVTVWNRSPEKIAPLVALGAQAATSPADAARHAEFLILMVSNGPTASAVLFGPDGAAPAMAEGAIVVDMSSIPPPTARDHNDRLAALKVGALDAPVSGGPLGAERGTLAIMAGGDNAAFDRARPILSVLGRPTLVGPAGSGQLAKLCNQIIVAVTIGAVSEALLLASAGGADPAKVREALTGGFADSLILQQHGGRMLTRNFVAGGPSALQLKDLRTIEAAAHSANITLPLAAQVTTMFQSLVDRGLGHTDHGALLLEIERLAGARIGDAPDTLTAT
jgi:2-hydroxy-3-oxopropionate reductase